MAYYAFLDKNNIVTEVITGVDENITQIDLDGTEVGGSSEAWETFYGNLKGQVCKRTSFNTKHGIHSKNGNPFRLNYAGIGYFYSEEIDGFIENNKTYNSMVLDTEKGIYVFPVPYPEDGLNYQWNEDNLSWVLTE